jgi:hypothetical protein
MATASLPRHPSRTPAPAAAILSILGNIAVIAVIGVVALGALVVPVAALLVFGPALLAAF